jgi:HlyD family secretion protein
MTNTELQKLRIDKSQKAPRRAPRRWPWIALVVLLAGAAIGAWRYQKAAAIPQVQTMKVRLPEGFTPDSDLVMLSATGYVIAAHKVELASKVVGRVAWVGVEMGDKVKKGQVLVRLEDDEYKAKVAEQQGQVDNAIARLRELEAGNRSQEIASALAQYDRAKVEAEFAERNYRRVLALKSTIKTSELDDAEALMRSKQAMMEYAKQQYDMMKAGARVEQIAAQRATVAQLTGALALAKVDLDNTVIRAPQDSTVLERNVEVGEFVTTGFVGDRGAKGYVVSIADLSDLLVELDIAQNDFAKVLANQPCWISTDAYPDRKYAGVVERISPVANRQKATVLVRVKVLNPDDFLKPDMNATVSFLSPTKIAATQAAAKNAPPQMLQIPATAVKDNAVFIVEDNKAIRRPVVVGNPTDNHQVEIRKGLTGGEDLILNPPQNLADNDPVKVTKQ